jgi:hypothetical protein
MGKYKSFTSKAKGFIKGQDDRGG